MEKIYKEMKERLKFLQTQEETEEIKWRISELKIAMYCYFSNTKNNFKANRNRIN